MLWAQPINIQLNRPSTPFEIACLTSFSCREAANEFQIIALNLNFLFKFIRLITNQPLNKHEKESKKIGMHGLLFLGPRLTFRVLPPVLASIGRPRARPRRRLGRSSLARFGRRDGDLHRHPLLLVCNKKGRKHQTWKNWKKFGIYSNIKNNTITIFVFYSLEPMS